MLVTRRESFHAGHWLRNDALSEERNLEVFGDDVRQHGHNYVLEVTVSGSIDEQTGYVVDFNVLSGVMRSLVLDDLDHFNLNTDVAWLHGKLPTAEVLASAIWDRLEQGLPAGSLQRVVIWETEKNRAERNRA
jgi:6-pyruvoyltetrahydropterin/6-carboxytetrahydropterin synthase